MILVATKTEENERFELAISYTASLLKTLLNCGFTVSLSYRSGAQPLFLHDHSERTLVTAYQALAELTKEQVLELDEVQMTTRAKNIGYAVSTDEGLAAVMSRLQTPTDVRKNCSTSLGSKRPRYIRSNRLRGFQCSMSRRSRQYQRERQVTIMREGRNALVARTIIYGLSGLLLWFCFQPLLVLTILNAKLLLLLFIGGMLVMFYLKLPKWLCVTICAGLILHAVHFLFLQSLSFTAARVVSAVFRTNKRQFPVALARRGCEIPDVFSAFMFYLVFGFVLFTVNHWLEKGRIILFVALAMLSSLAIDTLTYFDGRQTIVVQAAVALALLSFHQWQTFVQKGDKTHSLRMTRSWFAVTGMVIAAFLLFALMLPKPDSLWKGPANYLNGLGLSFFTNDSFFSGNQRIGYDDDDSRLGGSLAMDQTPLFTAAISGSPQYWRVAYKDHYTGHGWSNGDRYFMPVSGSRSLSEMLTLYGAKTKKNEQTAVLHFSGSSPAILPYAGEPQQITVPGKQVKLDQLNGQLLTVDERKADQATIRYEAPSYHTSALRAPASANDPQIIRDTYLQLPQKLPKRVQTLAKRLTDGKANRYDQVNAVVNYLRSSRFTYSTDRVPVPSNDQDYVDQFLFASKSAIATISQHHSWCFCVQRGFQHAGLKGLLRANMSETFRKKSREKQST
ncbi:transglutaminase-like enzymes [Sporolactobacillus inulinus]|uniref:Transglutaminase-like enzymes n=1 Tax=Sporolactobacillus inulinus TaxID=2078 RepID=A0A4Y1Z8M7_9BACL|nr:transglutaminase-like enzymes [Sporolactobacillus inulinus]